MTDSFIALGISPRLAEAANAVGAHEPTPVQQAVIGPVLEGRDVRAQARTGTGKTLAFVLPLLQRFTTAPITTPRRVSVLVLVPTRELAVQVAESFESLAPGLARPPRVECVFGGVSINPQMMALRGGADIVVATPGRLLDLVQHNAVRLSNVTTLVLDEADRLLDKGFADELNLVLTLLPPRRQTLLLSATFPAAVRTLADSHLTDPVQVEIADEPLAVPSIAQRAFLVDEGRRTALLAHLVRQEGWTRVLVFVASRHGSEHLAEKLRRRDLKAAAFHGDLSQGARTRLLEDFKSGHGQIVVATDIASRGIDIVELPVVVNYDLPRSAADHVHRIGRTGRAGAEGLAVSFITAATEAHFRLIEKRQGVRVQRELVRGFEPTETATEAQATGGVKGARKSKKDKLREAEADAAAAAAAVRRR
ncbi:DEAD/DEAH box helicase [Rhizobacter sp. LjRoot28]|uniref:DEAD/DEAH box helicase n=1 Tax=Rhizobacter sp. LjRoot28 TaxID=3342309 RepID=UPI003ECCA047